MTALDKVVDKIKQRSWDQHKGYYSNKDEDICLGPLAALLPCIGLIRKVDDLLMDKDSYTLIQEQTPDQIDEDDFNTINEELFQSHALLIYRLIEYTSRLGLDIRTVIAKYQDKPYKSDVSYKDLIGRIMYSTHAYHYLDRTYEEYISDNEETIYNAWMILLEVSLEAFKLQPDQIIYQYWMGECEDK